MKKSKKIVFSASLAALSAMLILLSKLIPMGVDVLPAIAGLFGAIIVIESGVKWAIAAYFVASGISFIFGLNEASLLYTMFFGYYPIIKSLLEKIRIRAVELVVKLLIFNVSVIAAYSILIPIFGLAALGFDNMTFVWIVLALGNVFFVLYDYGMTRLITMYFNNYHKHIKKLLK